jgi:hypothetical protein
MNGHQISKRIYLVFYKIRNRQTFEQRGAGNEYLEMENNLVKKVSNADSTGIGLSTIREKYKLL